jgi:hypothetical protein
MRDHEGGINLALLDAREQLPSAASEHSLGRGEAKRRRFSTRFTSVLARIVHESHARSWDSLHYVL